MPQGKILKLSDKGFGFIQAEKGDLFFHHSEVKGGRYDDLQIGQLVTYEVGEGRKGPCAVNVQPAE